MLCFSLRFLAAALGAFLLAVPVSRGAEALAPSLKKSGEYHLLTARLGAAAITVGDAIYIIGGSATGATADIERFDLRTQKVERITNQILPRRYHSVVEYDGRIYIFGGQGFGSRAERFEAVVEIFDPATRTLSQGTKMPAPRAHMAGARLGAMVCLAGGTKMKNESEVVHSNELDFYDLKTNTWTKGPPMPTTRESQGLAVGNFLIVPGGFRGSSRLAEVEMFVPQELAWKALPSLSRKVSGNSLGQLGSYLFLMGDYSDMQSVLAYDLSTRKTFELKVPEFKGARHTTAAVAGGSLYVIGGTLSDGDAALDLIQVFTLAPAAKK
jgi:hypothetical protein